MTTTTVSLRDMTTAGEKLIQLASDSLVTEILIHPQLSTLKQCMRNLLASFTRHRHVIHAGYTLSGSGSWILQVRDLIYFRLPQTFLFYERIEWPTSFCERKRLDLDCFASIHSPIVVYIAHTGWHLRIRRFSAHPGRSRHPAALSGLRIQHHDGSPLR